MKDIIVFLMLILLFVDGEFYLGEQLGEWLGMSCVVINKYIQILCDWGVDVFIVFGKGYSLLEFIQLLDVDCIYS